MWKKVFTYVVFAHCENNLWLLLLVVIIAVEIGIFNQPYWLGY